MSKAESQLDALGYQDYYVWQNLYDLSYSNDGSYRKSLYYKIIGPEFIELAFRFAHEADPNVELYYNDYSTSKPAKREAIHRLVTMLLIFL